jgi:curved DNA-binding protein CbpA
MATAYEILECAETARPETLRSAWRRLSGELHPDRPGTSEEREERARRFELVRRAYELVGEPDKRAAYDRRLAAGRTKAPPEKKTRGPFFNYASQAQAPAQAVPTAEDVMAYARHHGQATFDDLLKIVGAGAEIAEAVNRVKGRI